jgi:hypothetical protein
VNIGASRLLRWLAPVTGAAYILVVAIMAPELVHALYWDTDVSAPFVLAERLRGDGPVYIPHYGSWTVLWWLLATKHLPGQRELWEATGYPFAVAGAALVGWATARVAGRWAGLTAAAAALVVGPYALRSQLTVIFHVLPPFGVAVLAAYLVLLARRRSPRFAVLLAVLVGLLAGATAASDALLWPAGVAPFAIAAGVLFAATRRREIAVQAGIALGVTIAAALATGELMRRLDFNVVGLDVHWTNVADLPASVRHFGRMIALLGGANYALPHGYPPEPLRIVLGALVVLALAAAVFAGVKHAVARSEPLTRAFAVYCASAILLLGLSFVVTTNAVELGPGSANYLLPFALVAAAGTALLAAGSRPAQLAVAGAIAFVGAVNMAGIVQGHAGTPKGAIGTYEPELVQRLEKLGVTRGYAGYWDAQNLTWQSGLKLLVAPVNRCGAELCAFNFSVVRSWYEERSGPSFLIVDPQNGLAEPPPAAKDVAASYRFGPLTVYVFDYDLARHIRPPVAT